MFLVCLKVFYLELIQILDFIGYRPTHMQVMLSHDDASNPLYGTARSLQRSTSSA